MNKPPKQNHQHHQHHHHSSKPTPERKAEHHEHEKKNRVVVRAKDTPGIICIERNIHDEAIVISGTLTLEYGAADIVKWVAEELETAAGGVREREGIVGHIKTAITVTYTDLVSVTDENAMITDSPRKRARIALAAIVFMIEPEEAENTIRKALANVRARIRDAAREE